MALKTVDEHNVTRKADNVNKAKEEAYTRVKIFEVHHLREFTDKLLLEQLKVLDIPSPIEFHRPLLQVRTFSNEVKIVLEKLTQVDASASSNVDNMQANINALIASLESLQANINDARPGGHEGGEKFFAPDHSDPFC